MAKVQKIQTMKKTITILMALMVLCFTQCKKPIDELTGRKVKVSCTIPIKNGSKSDFTNLMEDGSIKWSTGTERIYLALPNETNPQIVELTAFSTLQSTELAFEGEVDENLIEVGDEYEVWYLGNSKNLDVPYITENKVGEDEIITSVSGSIAEQSGSIGDLGYCHIAKVSVTAVEEDGEIILPLRGVLKNQIAIAYLDLDSVAELSGAAIKGTEYNLQYNDSTNKYDFVVTESATATINVTAGTSKSFIVLLPNDNNNVILKCSKGGYEFKKGVEGNKFYYRYVSNVEKGTLRWEEMDEEEPEEPGTPDPEVPSNPPGTFTVNDVTFTMIEVEGNDDISDYYIGETEVTQALWQAVMGSNPSNFSGNPQRPVENVSWNKCQEFITKLNELTGKTFRLPTDAEWLYAAKGGNKSQGYTYSGSNNVADVAWYVGNCYETQNVKTKSQNELGIYDMSGNVAEWTSDIVSFNNDNKEYRHFHGGAYDHDNECCKVTYYSYAVPATATEDIGFRLCLSTITNPEQPEEPTIPEAPTNLVATATGQTAISLTWDAVQNATSYKVYSNDDVVASGLTEPTYTVENLTAGINYCYYVTAVTEAGESEPSAEACATTEVPSNPSGTFTVNGVTFTMIEVEGNGNDISDYYIGETEVTQALWQAVMGSNPSYFKEPQRPVERVTLEECQEFVEKLNLLTGENFIVPTKSQWLRAAKGGNKSQGYKYSGSNTVGDVAWYNGNSSSQTHDVKTKSPNELGIYDMSGNVAEWTTSTYNNYLYRFYGGAFSLSADNCKVEYYSYNDADTKAYDIGFRLCATTIINPGQPEESTIPEAPTNLVATATGQTTISLTWDAVQNATSYKVYSNGNVVVSGFAQTTYIVKNLTPGTQYCYEVKAVNEAGESEASESACATTESEPVTPTVPAAPTNLVATATGQTTISLTWTAVPNATSYNVYSNENVVASGLTVTSYTVEGLTAGTEYCYNVTAVNEIGESEHSAEACATTESVPTAPAAPTNLVATATGQTTISLTWDAVQNATSYNVYNGETVVVSGLTVTSYTVEGLTAGTQYCYKVTAVNEIGESEHSTEACATTEFPPIVIETITVNGVSFNMIQVEGGTFKMGSEYNPYDGITDYADEEPAHNVTLTTYSIGETEVTQELWKAVMGSDSPASWGELMNNDVYYPQRPAEFMSWGDSEESTIGDCQTFISKLNELTGKNFRLPTEAEWEYAARGGNRSKGYMYSGSNDVGEVAWYSGNLVDQTGKTKTHDVKTKKANELGIYDMSGNVLEWCNDWYGGNYYGNSPGENPQGPDQAETSTKHRVSRGGGWGHEAEYCRVAKRFSLEQDERGSNYGFRLCL